MGSPPLRPTISNLCLAHLENELLSVSKFKLELYLRYEDEFFCVFRAKSLPFLDAKVELPLDIFRDFKSSIFKKDHILVSFNVEF